MAPSTALDPTTDRLARTPTLADLADRLGVPPSRILLKPDPGSATVEDALALRLRERRLCELVDGVLLEKAMGFRESRLALILGYFLELHLEHHDLGLAFGADAMMRLNPGLVRIPDVAFVAWAQFPGRKLPDEQVPSIHPDLAVEVLSPSNTKAEMDRKLLDYFEAGTRLVWYLDPVARSVRAYTSAERSEVLDESGTLDGGDVLPGFRLPIRDWFARAERPGAGA